MEGAAGEVGRNRGRSKWDSGGERANGDAEGGLGRGAEGAEERGPAPPLAASGARGRGTAGRRRRGRRYRPAPGGRVKGVPLTSCPDPSFLFAFPFVGVEGPGASSGIPLGFERDVLALNWDRRGVPSWAPAQKSRQPRFPCRVGVAWEPIDRPGLCPRLGAPPREAWRLSGLKAGSPGQLLT